MTDELKNIISDLLEFFRQYAEGIGSVLDIGTGTSIPIHVFSERFPLIRYSTVDIADIRKMKKLPFILYDGVKLPFGDLEFDVSLLNETLHHCKDPGSVLSEAGRVGGLIYVIEHFPVAGFNNDELMKTEFEALRNFDIETGFYNPFTEDSLSQLFKSAKMIVLDKIEIPYYGQRRIKKFFFRLKCR